MSSSFFTPHLEEFAKALTKAAKSKKPGETLFLSNARSALFRLEALCRLYRGFQDKRIFDKWYKEFKALEDTLGAMDYHWSIFKQFGADKSLKPASEKLFLKRYREEEEFLDDVLHMHGWLNGEWRRRLDEDFAQVQWKDAELEKSGIIKEIISEIDRLQEKYESGEINLLHLENGVHEFRRRLRWISIYGAALNGFIQLEPTLALGPWKKYCTRDVIGSPFNKMPAPIKDREPIFIRTTHFYALSWLIQSLGEWKDIGLNAMAFHDLSSEVKGGLGAAEKKFLAACKIDPKDVSAYAENACDEFLYRDLVLANIKRDLLRCLSHA